MSISIYYTATRNVPLTPAERSAVDSLVVECSVDDQIAAGTGNRSVFTTLLTQPYRMPSLRVQPSSPTIPKTPSGSGCNIGANCSRLFGMRFPIPIGTSTSMTTSYHGTLRLVNSIRLGSAPGVSSRLYVFAHNTSELSLPDTMSRNSTCTFIYWRVLMTWSLGVPLEEVQRKEVATHHLLER
jgi:hypothetical protein